MLHAIAGPAEALRDGFVDLAGRLFADLGSALAIHLRLPGASGRRLWELAEAISRAAEAHGGWCVVNGRPDVALAARAQGVQVGRRAIPLEETLRLVADRAAVGASVHGAAEGVEAARRGANWVLLGTIYETASHPGIAGSGPGLIGRTVAALRAAGLPDRPVVAIGGIDAERARAVREAGAHGVAASRAVWSAGDPIEAARGLAAAVGRGDPTPEGGAT